MCSGVAGNLPRTWALACDFSGKSRRNHAMFAYQNLSDIVRAVSSSLGPVPCKSKPRENTSNIDGYPSGVT